MRILQPIDPKLDIRTFQLGDIQLGDLDAILILGCNLIQDRGDHFAGTTPLGPEIDEHRHGRFKDFLGEIGISENNNIWC